MKMGGFLWSRCATIPKCAKSIRTWAESADRVARFGGHLDFREEPPGAQGSVCLTYEFDQLDRAEAAAETLRQAGEHVEGPVDYGA